MASKYTDDELKALPAGLSYGCRNGNCTFSGDRNAEGGFVHIDHLTDGTQHTYMKRIYWAENPGVMVWIAEECPSCHQSTLVAHTYDYR